MVNIDYSIAIFSFRNRILTFNCDFRERKETYFSLVPKVIKR